MFMPPHRRKDIWAVYAFCRHADDLVDRPDRPDHAMMTEMLDNWEDELSNPRHPIMVAFADVRRRHAVDDAPARALLEGIRCDLNHVAYPTWEALRRYCYLVAGTVGELIAPVLGCRDHRALAQAAELGIAMQLTNILRDIAEDAASGRLYLPLDELHDFGCDPSLIMRGEIPSGFEAFMAFQIRRARGLYKDALPGTRVLSPSGRIATLVAANLYAGILDEIEHAPLSVLEHRAHVARGRKVGIVATTLAQMVTRDSGATSRPARLAPIRKPEPPLQGDWHG